MGLKRTKEIRRCPVPFPLAKRATCKLCGKSILRPDGKPDTRRLWHRECHQFYDLCTNMPYQREFLISRDGPFCNLCGLTILRPHPDARYKRVLDPEDGYPSMRLHWVPIGGQVDHRIPLWKVLTVDDVISRVWYFGPDNLQLLCVPCHTAKTKIEASHRAHSKRLADIRDGGAAQVFVCRIKSRGFNKTLSRKFDGRVVRRRK